MQTPTTIIPFARRHRWRWWAMLAMGLVFLTYGLALLSSPAWAPRDLFGVDGFWLWLRGEIYLIFGFLQAVIGVSYVRLTSRPEHAFVADANGITARRLFAKQRLEWRDITHLRKGRYSLVIATTPPTLWKLFLCDPRVMRLDATVVDANTDELAAMVARYYSGNQASTETTVTADTLPPKPEECS